MRAYHILAIDPCTHDHFEKTRTNTVSGRKIEQCLDHHYWFVQIRNLTCQTDDPVRVRPVLVLRRDHKISFQPLENGLMLISSRCD
jgi:hypothetical protein